MPQFEIKIGSWITIKKFNNKAEAQAWADAYKPGEPNTVIEVPTVVRSAAEVIAERRAIGRGLVDMFLLDNVEIAIQRGYALTTAEIIALQRRFSELISLCGLGSLQAVLDTITATEIDAIFTQPRKDKYIALLQSALS